MDGSSETADCGSWRLWLIWSPSLGNIHRQLKRSISPVIRSNYIEACIEIITRLGMLIPNGFVAVNALKAARSKFMMVRVLHNLCPRSQVDAANRVYRIAVEVCDGTATLGETQYLNQVHVISAYMELGEMLYKLFSEGDIVLIQNPLELEDDGIWLNHQSFHSKCQMIFLRSGDLEAPADFRKPLGEKAWAYENKIQMFYVEGDAEGKQHHTLLRIVPLNPAMGKKLETATIPNLTRGKSDEAGAAAHRSWHAINLLLHLVALEAASELENAPLFSKLWLLDKSRTRTSETNYKMFKKGVHEVDTREKLQDSSGMLRWHPAKEKALKANIAYGYKTISQLYTNLLDHVAIASAHVYGVVLEVQDSKRGTLQLKVIDDSGSMTAIVRILSDYSDGLDYTTPLPKDILRIHQASASLEENQMVISTQGRGNWMLFDYQEDINEEVHVAALGRVINYTDTDRNRIVCLRAHIRDVLLNYSTPQDVAQTETFAQGNQYASSIGSHIAEPGLPTDIIDLLRDCVTKLSQEEEDDDCATNSFGFIDPEFFKMSSDLTSGASEDQAQRVAENSGPMNWDNGGKILENIETTEAPLSREQGEGTSSVMCINDTSKTTSDTDIDFTEPESNGRESVDDGDYESAINSQIFYTAPTCD